MTDKIEKVKELLNSDKYDGHQRIELLDGYVLDGQDKTPMADSIFEGIDLMNKTLLDVGTAYGFFCYEAIKKGAKKVIGIENNPDRYEVAKKIIQIKEENVELIKLDIEKESLKEKFDVVLLLNVIHHLHFPIETIKKLADITNELLIVEFPTPTDKKLIRRSKLNRFFLWLVKDYPIIAIGNKEYHNTYYFSKNAFKTIFLKHTKLFKKITWKKSHKDGRLVAYCYK
ncbi:MAG: methyltransferase domain-containing protein [Desulfobacteraceae bacterium]|nr:methyltransferase domain-containing protein [Desulfobacteraceae bacterium]